VVLPAGPLPGGPGLEGVLRHELAHLYRRDGWSALTGELLVVVFWWHPLAWVVRRQLLLAAEFACDDWVLAGGADATDYVAALLALVPVRRTPAAVPAAVSHLAVRVRRLLGRARVHVPELGRAWCAAALGLTVLLAVGVALLHARPGPLPAGGAKVLNPMPGTSHAAR
jgi:beta-lactamase regulating signal transducer with metallopeptidase domain